MFWENNHNLQTQIGDLVPTSYCLERTRLLYSAQIIGITAYEELQFRSISAYVECVVNAA